METLLTLDQVAALLSISRRGVYRLIEQSRLQPIRLDRRPRFMASDVEAMIAACQSPVAESGRDSRPAAPSPRTTYGSTHAAGGRNH